MSEPRFYVREHSGYTMQPSGKSAGNALERLEVMVIDRHYCHEVVRSFSAHAGRNLPRSSGHARDRADAAALCETLNEWALAVA